MNCNQQNTDLASNLSSCLMVVTLPWLDSYPNWVMSPPLWWPPSGLVDRQSWGPGWQFSPLSAGELSGHSSQTGSLWAASLGWKFPGSTDCLLGGHGKDPIPCMRVSCWIWALEEWAVGLGNWLSQKYLLYKHEGPSSEPWHPGKKWWHLFVIPSSGKWSQWIWGWLASLVE